MTEEHESIGERFQRETKLKPGEVLGDKLDVSKKPDRYKEYPDRKKFKLPPPESITDMPLDRALRQRKSIRQFTKRPMSIEQLSYVLWASDGIQRVEGKRELRTAPSAGARYPLETYLVVNNVEGLEKGLYHYHVKDHMLEELKPGDFGEDIAKAAYNQKMCSEAQVVFMWTAFFYRCKWRYRDLAYRVIYLDAGHIGQNLALCAVSLGLGSCQIAAFFDDEVNRLIGVDGIQESIIYMSIVGEPL